MDISLNLGKTSFGDTFAVRVNDTNQIRISELKFLIWNEKKEMLGIILTLLAFGRLTT